MAPMVHGNLALAPTPSSQLVEDNDWTEF